MLKHLLQKNLRFILNNLLGFRAKSCNSNEIKKLLINIVLSDDKQDIANLLNQYFVDVGDNLASALPLSSVSFKSYTGPPIQNSIFVSSISIEEVNNLINSMSGGTAAGDDGFSLNLIK